MQERIPAVCVVIALSWSCSQSTEEQVAHYVHGGDRYVEQQQFAEAVIEYKNAARAAPNDVSIHWKLAQASLKLKDFQTALVALARITVLDSNHYEAQETLGQLYLAAGKTKEAARIADNLLTKYSQHPGGYRLQGRLSVYRGDLAAAAARFEEAVKRDPTNDETMVMVGHLYLLQQQPAEAGAWYDRALKTNPDSIGAHIARGNYYFGAGRSEDGEQDFQSAVALSNNSEHTRLIVAVQHLTQGRTSRGEQELIAIADGMKSRTAHVLLAELKLELGKLSEAKPLVAAVLKNDEHDPVVTYLQGRIALAENRRGEARTFFDEALKQDRGMASAHLYLGVLNLMEGRRAAGEAELLEAAKLDHPANAKAHLALASLYLSENSLSKAELEALEVLRRNPAHVEAAALYGDSFYLRDDWERAESVYSAILRELPDSSIGPAKMAVLKRRQGLTAQAADFFAEAARRSPNDDGLMSEYLLALVAAERKDKASRLLKDYLHKAPQNPVRWEVAGAFHVGARQYAEAEKAFQRAAALAPDRARPAYNLAQLYLAQRKLAEAEAALQQVLRLEEAHEGAHTLLGGLLAAQGRRDEANAQYRRAVELRPSNHVAANNLAASLLDSESHLDEALHFGRLALEAAPGVAAIQDTVGWIYFKKGSIAEAYPLLTRAASALGDNPTVLYHYAKVLERRGEKALAVAELEAAFTIAKTFSGSEEAATMLAALRE